MLFACFFIFILSMLYWSSLLQEKDLKKVRYELKELHTEMAGLGQKLSRELNHLYSTAQASIDLPTSSSYPNLLEKDAYYEHILPQLLGEQFRPTGILNRALVGKPENLHPFNGFRDVAQMIEMCSLSVADLKTGYYESMSPKMAVRLEARPRADNPSLQEFWIFLREDVFWEPLNSEHFPDSLELAPHFLKRHPVTAYDFKFFYDAVMNPYIHESKAASLKSYYKDIEEFKVIDTHTFVVRWKAFLTTDENGHEEKKTKYTSLSLTSALQPLPAFVFQYFADGEKILDTDTDPDTYKTNSVWAQNFVQHWAKNVIVSCGPYIFDGMTEEGISFKRNPHYFDPFAVLVEGMKFYFKESIDATWQDFKAGKIDLCTLSPNQSLELDNFLESPEYLKQTQKHGEINVLDYVDLSYFYIGWNELKPFFSDDKVRKAMTLAIDRRRIIEQNLNMMAISITGPFFRYSSAYDENVTPYPFDPQEARQLLEEAGWVDIDGDGIRDKIINGVKIPFQFKLCYFIKNLSTRVIAEYIMSALRDVGIQCELNGVDIADLSRQFEEKKFDAILMGWKLGTPPEDPRQLWHSSGAQEKGSSNAISFSNSEIDQLIEQLNYEHNKNKRIELYHKFHQIIHKEEPYTFLYTPKVRLVYRDYVQNIFIPREREDLTPQADVSEPNLQTIWLNR